MRPLSRACLYSACLAVAVPAFADLKEGVRLIGRGRYAEAYEELKKDAEKGDVLASRFLASLLDGGAEVVGGERFEGRPEEAAHWYRKAAELGDKYSASMLGVLYTSGRGVARDYDEAIKWFSVSAPVSTDEEWLGQYPREDRKAIVAWSRAVSAAMKREMRYPKDAARRNLFGEVELLFEAEGPVVRAAGPDRRDALSDAAEKAGRRALEAAPPPEAAMRNKARLRTTVHFRLQ